MKMEAAVAAQEDAARCLMSLLCFIFGSFPLDWALVDKIPFFVDFHSILQRKTDAAIAAHKEKAAKRLEAKEQQQQQQGWFQLKTNTSVYVTGLPGDTTPEEVAGVFSKCGILKLGEDGQPRIKLYRWGVGAEGRAGCFLKAGG